MSDRFVKVVSKSSGGAEREVLMPFDTFVEEIAEVGGTVPVKASGEEVDTGTDDAKFVTAKAIADSDYIKEADLPAAATYSYQLANETPNGIITTFTWASNVEHVLLNGVGQEPDGEDVTITTVTAEFEVAPLTGDFVRGWVED